MDPLERLQNIGIQRQKFLDKVSEKIRNVESTLQSVVLPSFSLRCGEYILAWDSDSRRLVVVQKNRPLIECKVEVKEDLYPHLDDFLEKFISFHESKLISDNLC